MRHVGDRDPEVVGAVLVAHGPDGVVVIARVLRVDRGHRKVRQVFAADEQRERLVGRAVERVTVLGEGGQAQHIPRLSSVLGLDIIKSANAEEAALPAEITRLVEERNAARKAKDWAKSDELRAALQSAGYEVGDSPQGTTVKRRLL